VASIGLDHTEYLGPTLESIAREKAGIFKAGVPAVIGEPSPEVAGWLAASAREAGASAIRVVGEETRTEDVVIDSTGTAFTLHALGASVRLHTTLVGQHQATNFAFTLLLLDAAGVPVATTPEDAGAAADSIRLPGRFQRVGRWIFDVAHNADGARTLAATLATVPGHDGAVTVLLCVLADKDWREMMVALMPIAARFILTDSPTAPASRRWALDEVATFASSLDTEIVVEPDFDAALARAQSFDGRTLVTGSFHTVGDAMARLQVSPLTG
jgi:dihydrofolate synthase/folylpolyglutamate synthase